MTDDREMQAANLLFVSYGRRDAAEFANKLRSDLEARGYHVWQDLREIQPGIDFIATIEDGLRKAHVLLALLSPHSVRRQCNCRRKDEIDSVCLDELSFARFSAHKPIVPIMVIPCESPFVISHLDWIDMTGWNQSPEEYAMGFNRLLQAIEDIQQGGPGPRSRGIHLDAWDFTPFLDEKRRHFVGRDWLFDDIESWRRASNERALLLTGSPGTGKSAIVAELVHYNPGGQILAYHCCQADTSETLKPSRFIRSLASQIASRLDAYASLLSEPAIREALSVQRCLEDPASSFEEGLLIPLHRISSPAEGIRYVIIDALDEAVTCHHRPEHHTIVDVLTDRMDRLPPWMRIVATTRKEHAVLAKFRTLRQIDLDEHDSRNRADIAAYVRRRINAVIDKPSISSNHCSPAEIESVLAQKSEGNFLYVVEAIKSIERRQYSPDQLDHLPPGIGGLYERFFERCFPADGNDRESSWSAAQSLLQVVVAAQEPLTKELLSQVTSLDLEGDLPRLLNLLSSYLVPIESTAGPIQYRLFHKSFTEWLTAEQQQGHRFFISRREGHKQLAQAGWTQYQDASGKMSPYMQRYLPIHLVEINETREWERLLLLIKENRLQLTNRWVHKGDSQDGLRCMEGLVEFLTGNHQDMCFAGGLLTQIAKIYTQRGMYERSEKLLKQALEISTAREGRRIKAIAQHELGSLYLYRGNLTSAERAYQQALRTCTRGWRRLQDEEAANLAALATIALTRYQQEKAIKLANRALDKSQNVNDVRHMINAHHIIASAHKNMMRYEQAKTDLDIARLLAERAGESLETLNLRLLHAWLSFERATIQEGDISRAEDLFGSTATEAAQRHHLWYHTEARLGMVWCALARKDTNSAYRLLQEIAENTRAFENRTKTVKLTLAEAMVPHQLGHLEAAQGLYREAQQTSQAYEYFSIESIAWTGLGATQFHADDTVAANASWERARTIAGRCSPAREQLTHLSIERSRADPKYTPR